MKIIIQACKSLVSRVFIIESISIRNNLKVCKRWLGMVTHGCNPSTWEAETRESVQVQGQPTLHRKPSYIARLSQKQQQKGIIYT